VQDREEAANALPISARVGEAAKPSSFHIPVRILSALLSC